MKPTSLLNARSASYVLYFRTSEKRASYAYLFIMRKGLNPSFAPSLIPILETFDQQHMIFFSMF